MKFEEAYHIQQRINIPLYDLNNIFINQPNVFENRYRRYLFCPECRQAQLSYNNAKTSYLSAYPRSEHDNDCELAQNVANKTEAERIVTEYKSNVEIKDNIKRQIDSTLRLLTAEHINFQNRNNAPQQQNIMNMQGENMNAHNQAVMPRLPRKRIDLPLHDSDYNVYKIFYGNVILKWKPVSKESTQKDQNKIKIYIPRTQTLQCSIKITDNYINIYQQNIKTLIIHYVKLFF